MSALLYKFKEVVGGSGKVKALFNFGWKRFRLPGEITRTERECKSLYRISSVTRRGTRDHLDRRSSGELRRAFDAVRAYKKAQGMDVDCLSIDEDEPPRVSVAPEPVERARFDKTGVMP